MAFYFANDDILLASLHFCCIQGVNADWLRFYLKNREQKFEITSSKATQNFLSDLSALTWRSLRVNSRARTVCIIHK